MQTNTALLGRQTWRSACPAPAARAKTRRAPLRMHAAPPPAAAAPCSRRHAARAPARGVRTRAAPPRQQQGAQTVLAGACYEDIVDQLAHLVAAAADQAQAARPGKFIVGIAGGREEVASRGKHAPQHAWAVPEHASPAASGACRQRCRPQPRQAELRAKGEPAPVRRPTCSRNAGVPGSGKSTLAQLLCARLNQLLAAGGGAPGAGGGGDSDASASGGGGGGVAEGAPAAVVVPMDGFHYYKRQLDAMPDPKVCGPAALAHPICPAPAPQSCARPQQSSRNAPPPAPRRRRTRAAARTGPLTPPASWRACAPYAAAARWRCPHLTMQSAT